MNKSTPVLCIIPSSWQSDLISHIADFPIPIALAPSPSSLSLTSLENLTTEQRSILVVTPPHRAPRSLAPGPVLNGCPLALFPCKDPSQFKQFLNSALKVTQPSRSAVLAEWNDHYLALGKKMTRALRQAGRRPVHSWPDTHFNREDLLLKLATSPTSTFYFGHGGSEGLLAYQGISREDLAFLDGSDPLGLFAAFSCDTLKKPRRGQPFGCHLVSYHYAKAFLGSCHSVKTIYNTALVEVARQTLVVEKPETLDAWLIAIDQTIRRTNNQSALSAWKTYRLIGWPTLPL